MYGEIRMQTIKKGNPCIKCGYILTKIKVWDHYYCGHYCCNPCCPDATKSPCSKEEIEHYTKMIKEIEETMRSHLKEKGRV